MAEYSTNYTNNTISITADSETYKFSRVVSTVNPSVMDNTCIYCGAENPVLYDYYPTYNYTATQKTLMDSKWRLNAGKFEFTNNSKNTDFNITFALCDYNSTVTDSGKNSVYQIGKTIYNEATSSANSNIRVLNPIDIRKMIFYVQFDGYLGTSMLLTSNKDIKYLMDHPDNFFVTAIRFNSYFWNGSNYTSTPTRLNRIRPCIVGSDFFLPLTTALAMHEFDTTDYNSQKTYNNAFYGAYDSDGMGICHFPITADEKIPYSTDPPNTNVISDNGNKFNAAYNYYTSAFKLYSPASTVLKLLAHCGCYFMDDSYSLSGKNLTNFWNDTHIYLGEMKAGARTTGNFIKGTDLLTSNTINKGEFSSQTDFTPGGGGGGSDEDEDTAVSTVGTPFGTGLAHYYVSTVDSTVLSQISEAMSTWDIDATKKDLYRNLISCKLMKPPAGIPATPSVFEIYGVKPQYQGADITINAVDGNPDIAFDAIDIPRKFNDFRDYAPYSKAEIFIPYCGWTALPSHVIGRSVSVSYFTDVIAGTVKAVVFCENNVVAEAAGVMAVDIPFASQNVGAKIQAATTGLLSYGQGAFQTAVGIGQAVATKGQSGIKNIASGLASVIGGAAQMAMTANENWTEINGKSGDGTCLAGIDTIIVKITRPKYGDYEAPYYVPAEFPHTVGFIAMKKATVGDCTGLIICDNVDTSGIAGATDRERQLIKNYLENGIIVEHPATP